MTTAPDHRQALSTRLSKVPVTQLVAGDALWLQCFGGEPVAHAVSPGGPLAARCRAAFFAYVTDTDRETGSDSPRLAAFIDERAPELLLPHAVKRYRYGSFGLLRWSQTDISVLEAMLRAAAEWLKAEGAEYIVGPIDFSIFHGYRVMSTGYDRPSFLGEVRQDPMVRVALEQCGLTPLSTWRSYDMSADDHKAQVAAIEPRMETLKDTLAAYRVEPIVCDGEAATAKELTLLYPLIMESFADNFAATQLSEDEFRGLYRPLAPLICPRSSVRIMFGESCVGFSISYINPLLPGTVVWHSFGNTAAHRGRGLGVMCIHQTFSGFVEQGYIGSFCAFVKDGPNHFEHTHRASRTYQIMGRKLR